MRCYESWSKQWALQALLRNSEGSDDPWQSSVWLEWSVASHVMMTHIWSACCSSCQWSWGLSPWWSLQCVNREGAVWTTSAEEAEFSSSASPRDTTPSWEKAILQPFLLRFIQIFKCFKITFQIVWSLWAITFMEWQWYSFYQVSRITVLEYTATM